MGRYISIGFVFKNDKLNLLSSILKNIMDSLKTDSASQVICKTCSDIEGEKWFEKKFLYEDMQDDDFVNLFRNHYLHLDFTSTFLETRQVAHITLYKGYYFFGFLIDFYEKHFIEYASYDSLEEKLLSYIKNSHDLIKYDYAFCDNEGEIEYSPYEIYDDTIDYSLLLIHDKKSGLILRKGTYLLDGETKRETA